MEKNPSLASQDVIDESSILKLKIATAIAIIRMKPSDMTAQQYTQQLSQQMKNNNESWKKKAQRMEMELLQTRQELVKTKLGCNDKESGKDSEEIAHQSSASVFPTPPCSADNSSHTRSEVVKHHTQFLQHVLTLQSCIKDLPLLDSCDVSLTAKDTIIHCIRNICKLVKDMGCDLPTSKLKLAVEKIMEILECPVVEKFKPEIQQQCMELMQDILNFIIYNSQLNQTSYQSELSNMGMVLAQNRIIQHSIVKTVVDGITKYSGQLRKSLEENTDWDPLHFENSYYLFLILEDILTGVIKNRKLLQSWPDSLTRDIQQQLDDCLLHISHVFPLYSHYVWKITAILQNLQ